MKLSNVQFTPAPSHLVRLRPKVLSQYPVLEHPQPMFLPPYGRPSFTPIQNNRYVHNTVCFNLRISWIESGPNNSVYFLICICSYFFMNTICWVCSVIFDIFTLSKDLLLTFMFVILSSSMFMRHEYVVSSAFTSRIIFLLATNKFPVFWLTVRLPSTSIFTSSA
jgi:hypothetical protein